MIVNENTKIVQKIYCKTVLAEQGELTKELFDKIDDGDQEVMIKVYADQQDRIRNVANRIGNIEDQELILSQIDSIQEVLDNLEEILKQ